MSYMRADDMFKKFTAHTCQGDRPIMFRQVTVSFFVDWGHDGFGLMILINGNYPVSRD